MPVLVMDVWDHAFLLDYPIRLALAPFLIHVSEKALPCMKALAACAFRPLMALASSARSSRCGFMDLVGLS